MDLLLLAWALASTGSLLAWVWLVLARGRFWRTDQRLPAEMTPGTEVPGLGPGGRGDWPAVTAIVPARNEASVLPRTLPMLLRQDYPGAFRVVLVDDSSDDGTAEKARRVAGAEDDGSRLTVVAGEPLAEGWTGKVWALDQGVHAREAAGAEYLLLTDADIAHPTDSVHSLVSMAEGARLDLVSLMAHLRVENAWDRMLIPAFVFFFAKLYPFRWASDPSRSTAAAAGGCVLVRREALEHAGGLGAISNELIDDCALAGLIKRRGGRIWLGLTKEVRSIREYDGLRAIWTMVARAAYAQLRFSPALLAATVLGMFFLYLVPPASALGGLIALILTGDLAAELWLTVAGLAAWALMAGAYLPMLRWYRVPATLAPLLPITAALYTAMTVDSAVSWWRGEGGAWKGRSYSPTERVD